MPIALPPSPTLGDIYPYNGKNWRWMNGYWSAASQYAPSAGAGPNTTLLGVGRNTYEALIGPGVVVVPIATPGVSLDYL